MKVRPNAPARIVFRALDGVGEPVTGLSITVKVFNPANGQIWDWSTSAFSASPSQPTTTMTETNASTLPGYYYASWPGGAAGYYVIDFSPPAGLTANDYPPPAEIEVEEYAIDGSAMTLTSGERTAIGAAVWATVTPNASWTYGESVELGRKNITNRLDATATGGGTLILYDDNGTTALVTQTLRGGGGENIVTVIGSPALRGAAS